MVNEGKPALSSIQIKFTGMVNIKDGERVAGYWLLVTGCWLLVAGCWLLVTGYWLLVLLPFFELINLFY